jgi:hypothetical protein
VSQAVETQHEIVLMKEASPQMHLGSMLQLAGRAWVMQEMAPNSCLSIHIGMIYFCRHIQLGILWAVARVAAAMRVKVVARILTTIYCSREKESNAERRWTV